MSTTWDDILGERLARINEMIPLLRRESAFYSCKFSGFSIKPLKAIGEIATLPLTTREELQASGAASCVRRGKKAHAYFESSGTGGHPMPGYPDMSPGKASVFGRFLDEWMGLRSGKVQTAAVALPYEMSPTGLRFQLALQSSGITVVPIGVRSITCPPERALNIIKRTQPQALFSRPFELLRYGDMLRQQGAMDALDVRKIFYLGESMSRFKWQRIRSVWNDADLYGHYGLTEVDTGLHTCALGNYHEPVNPFVHFELLDGMQQVITKTGVCGEIVISTLRDTAAPLLRYRTGDMALRIPCACGSPSPAYTILGRFTDRITIGGRFFFPVDIEDMVFHNPAIGNEYQFIIEADESLTLVLERALSCTEALHDIQSNVHASLPPELRASTNIEIRNFGEIADKLGIAKKKGAQFAYLRGTKYNHRADALRINIVDSIQLREN